MMYSDEPTTRTIELENGNKVHFKRDPRYGFWTVNFDKGGVPGHLTGVFTSYKNLYEKTQAYIQTRRGNKTDFKSAGLPSATAGDKQEA